MKIVLLMMMARLAALSYSTTDEFSEISNLKRLELTFMRLLQESMPIANDSQSVLYILNNFQ